MPTVICGYCMYVGQGECETTMWQDAQVHELEHHMEELIDEYGQDHIDYLKEVYEEELKVKADTKG